MRLLLLLLLFFPGGPGYATEGDPPTRNLVLITLDTTRADRIGAWGWEAARTPNLDTLAANGTRFARCDAAVPVTLPSHATIFTGLYPPRHGVRDNGAFVLDENYLTVAEELTAHGYDTGAVISAAVLQKRYGLAQGFRLYDDDLLGANETNATAATDRALDVLGELRSPYFLWVHYFDPHAPYEPDYDGEIAFMDQEIGRLLESVGDKATIIVVGDHGEMLGDHGEPEHGLLLNHGARRVPLIVAGPNLPKGRTVDCLVRTADVHPTLRELAGLEKESSPDSISLLGYMEGKPTCGRTSYSESFLPFYAYGWYPLRAFSDDDWLYVHGPRPGLFDLKADPVEEKDIAGANVSIVERLRLALEKIAGEPLEGGAPAAKALSSEEVERLRALGYLGGGAAQDQELEVTLALPDPRDMVDVAQSIQRAGVLIREKRCEEALPLVLDVARRDPRNFPAVNMAGLCLRDLGRIESALNAFQRASALNPRAVEPLNNAAGCLLQLERYGEAEEVLRGVLDLDAAAPGAASNLASLLRQKGDTAGAKAALDLAFAAGSHHAGLYIERGVLQAQAGNLEAALADFDEAGRRDPNNPSAWDNGARAALMLRRPQDAVERYEKLAGVVPPSAGLWAMIGQLYIERLGNQPQGEAALRRALEISTDPQERARIEAMLRR